MAFYRHTLISAGCVRSKEYKGYAGYYRLDIYRINLFNTPVTKKEVYNIWQKTLWRSRLVLGIDKVLMGTPKDRQGKAFPNPFQR
jgi:hypothetical protein